MTAPAPLEISEAEWQEQVTDLASALGWRWLHVRRSIGKGRTWTTATNVTGWPDLHLWSERQQRVMYVELKSEAGIECGFVTAAVADVRTARQAHFAHVTEATQ